ncbi:S41 family peptidase [Aestuariibacter salexigens]|uniref:S41 family peptidase n=1 Tax=Aestuariibacter salexigens TaxID=226010 RepID=UPI001F0A0A87|nr:S41 family peptidase [Aestuariibacter salexigens]
MTIAMGNSGMKHFLTILSLCLLTACGGGSSSSPREPVTNPPPPPPPSNEWQVGVFPDADQFAAQCVSPRNGVDINGNPWPDVAGSETDEKMWLRSWSHDTYLWYDEIDDVDPAGFASPQAYFDVLKTTQTTASGVPKDNFHFYQPTDEYQSFSQSGAETGYGAEWAFLRASPPRDLRVSTVQPGSSAALAGVQRGDRLIDIDGVDVINGSNVDFLNDAIFPSDAGQRYQFTFQRVDGSELVAELTSQTVVKSFVNNVQVLDTQVGRVGYLRFDGFQRPAQGPLISAFQSFVDQNVTSLVLDLRYNGGGVLAMSSQLGYMIAGPSQTAGRTFELLKFNDKYPNTDPVTGRSISPTPFYSQEIDWQRGVLTDQQLPSLGLTQVTVIVTEDSCSASEALINALRGIDVEVIQIGGRTCGKPYGFYPTDNCGTTYFTIQFQGVNDKGFGAYADGFKPVSAPQFNDELPGCVVEDDFSSALGSVEEGMLETALHRLTTGSCPTQSVELIQAKPDSKRRPSPLDVMDPRYRSMLLENKLYTPLDINHGVMQ